MSASLVGSEMCIRDSPCLHPPTHPIHTSIHPSATHPSVAHDRFIVAAFLSRASFVVFPNTARFEHHGSEAWGVPARARGHAE
eukprot:5788655-Alexandrium_andersonii.AAC.1